MNIVKQLMTFQFIQCFPPPSTKPRGRPPLGSEPGKGSDGGSNRQTPEEECMEDMEDTNVRIL